MEDSDVVGSSYVLHISAHYHMLHKHHPHQRKKELPPIKELSSKTNKPSRETDNGIVLMARCLPKIR
jgi:hypothetical protein